MDPALLYRGFDAFAFSSYTKQMPFSITEAMTSGLAISAADVGDIVQTVLSDNLPFITSCNDEQLAQAILALRELPAHGRAIGIADRRHAETHFDEMAMSGRNRALFEGTERGRSG